MDTLTDILTERIRHGGPITVAAFMAEALSHPTKGYYTTRVPFGAAGDFTTAPEISQMFGELIGLWCVLTWEMLGSPPHLTLVEMGPGRGTLMVDLLRVVDRAPAFSAAAEVWMVETSPVLTALQQEALRGRSVHWCERFEDLPDAGPLLLVANEVFDALPIRQFEKHAGQWHERMVGLSSSGEFAFLPGPVSTPDIPEAVASAVDGSIVEVCPLGRDLSGAIGARLERDLGAALLVDYGHPFSAVGDTLQAVKRHRFHDVLRSPGDADLTAHVDFEALAKAARPARAWGPLTQRDFLQSLGIEARATLLAREAGPKTAADIAGQMRRLIHPEEMGTLFKVLALSASHLPAPPGFGGDLA